MLLGERARKEISNGRAGVRLGRRLIPRADREADCSPRLRLKTTAFASRGQLEICQSRGSVLALL